MSAVNKQHPIPRDALLIIERGRCVANRFYLPDVQLDRALYVSVNKVLVALGGKWNSKLGAHQFSEDCGPLVDDAVSSGFYTKPGDEGWYATPPDLADHLVAKAEVGADMMVLEPSAGLGAIVEECLGRGANVDAIEMNEKRAKELAETYKYNHPALRDAKQTVIVRHANFLEVPARAAYDRVVMNPPFAARADIHHVMHARKFLKPGGILAAIMSAGVDFRTDRLTCDFRGECSSIERLPEGSFKASGTNVNTVLITMRAPA